MTEELLVNVTPQETRVAVIENGGLQELHVERSGSRGIVGNIYKGKIVRVLPGMQATFVEVGLDRTAFLHAADMLPHRGNGNADISGEEPASVRPEEVPDISRLVHEGQELVVQVAKDPIGSKGARLTTQLSIPSRHLVLLPGSTHRGISQRIADIDERDRLKQALDTALESSSMVGGFIVRTAAESLPGGDFLADIEFLRRSWQRIEQRMQSARAGELIHADLPLSLRVIRDLAREDVEKVRIDRDRKSVV